MKMKNNRSVINATPKTLRAPIVSLAVMGSLIAGANAAMYALTNNDKENGIVEWSVTDGALTGALKLTSINVPNITAVDTSDPTQFAFSYDPAVISEFKMVYTASGGGGSGASSVVDNYLLSVDNTAGSEFYFTNAIALCKTGVSTYGPSTAPGLHQGNQLIFNDSGSGVGNSFIVNTTTQFEVIGEGADNSEFGWNMGFASGAPGGAPSSISGAFALTAVPEPSSTALFGLGFVSLAFRRSRK